LRSMSPMHAGPQPAIRGTASRPTCPVGAGCLPGHGPTQRPTCPVGIGCEPGHGPTRLPTCPLGAGSLLKAGTSLRQGHPTSKLTFPCSFWVFSSPSMIIYVSPIDCFGTAMGPLTLSRILILLEITGPFLSFVGLFIHK
jgi:hypothetical protein